MYLQISNIFEIKKMSSSDSLVKVAMWAFNTSRDKLA